MTQHFFKIVGLIGKYNSGKDTAADMFVDWGFTKIAFAEPLKRILHEHFEVPPEELWGESHQRSERTRKMLQHLGTDFAREFDPNIWVNKLVRRIEDIRSKNMTRSGVVVSDVRFPNEAGALLGMGGKLIKIIRKDNELYTDEKIKKHYSETAIDTIPSSFIDVEIFNDGTLAEFKQTVEQIIKTILS